MMKHLSSCLALLFVVSGVLADGVSLEKARERWLRGNYEEAREMYLELGKDAMLREAAAIGVSQTWQSKGEYDKALESVDKALVDGPKNVELLARRAELLYLRGRWDDSEKAANEAIGIKKNCFLARWTRARIYRDRGDTNKAQLEFRWIVNEYSDRVEGDKAVKDPDDLLVVGLAACENARWKGLSDEFQIVNDEIYGDALKNDKNYWPALYEKGALFLEKYNRGDALTAFEKALVINPQAAEVFVGKGAAALQKLDIKDAEQFAEQALKVNPHLVEALALRADVHLAVGAIPKAMKELEQAREINPNDEQVLGRIAGCLLLQKNQKAFDELTEALKKRNPKAGMFHHVLAEYMEDRRRYAEAVKYYKQSIALMPMLPFPKNSLGLLYMRLGREKEALAMLTKAFEADEFNVRVDNSLKVLQHLEKYRTIRTEHFELRYDPDHDQYLAQYMSRYLEETYTMLAEKFQYRPKGPILVEVFSRHDMFSGRIVALPDLHTIGACTGGVMAMVSPRGKGIRKPFNWARVLRHELVHIFNLQQTNFLVPHWLTEGLAVISEGYPRPQQWNQLLLQRVPAGELMNLEDIDMGFIRPRSPLDWHMAYCQSQLYVEYLEKTHGRPAIGAILAAYAEGLDTDGALKKACGVERRAFEKGYRTYLDQVVLSLGGKPAEKAMTFRELKEAQEKAPNDLDLKARLADYYVRRDRNQARKLADEILEQKNNHPLASCVKARLLQAAGEDEKALELLEAAAGEGTPEPKVLELLGKLYFDGNNLAKAAEVFEQGHKAEPHESKWLSELSRVYARTGEKQKKLAILEKLAPTDPDDIDVRKELSKMLHEEGKDAEAELYARQALEIDVLDMDAEMALADSLAAQKKFPAAIEVYLMVVSLQEKSKTVEKAAGARLKLAQAYQETGDKPKALNEVMKVLARDPDNAEATRLKALLEK